MNEYLCLICRNCGEKTFVNQETIFGHIEYLKEIECRYFQRTVSQIYTVCPGFEKKEQK